MASFFRAFLAFTFVLSLLGLAPITSTFAADKLVVYSGRAERLIKPVLDEFQAKSGIQIELLSSGTTELVNRLQAEGDHTAADVFLTNDAGSLEHARERNLLKPMDIQEVKRAIPPSIPCRRQQLDRSLRPILDRGL